MRAASSRDWTSSIQHLFPTKPSSRPYIPDSPTVPRMKSTALARSSRAFTPPTQAASAPIPSSTSDHADHEIEEDRGFHIVGGYGKLIEALVQLAPRYGDHPDPAAGDADRLASRAGGGTGRRGKFRAHAGVHRRRGWWSRSPLACLQQELQPLGAVTFKPPLVEKRACPGASSRWDRPSE